MHRRFLEEPVGAKDRRYSGLSQAYLIRVLLVYEYQSLNEGLKVERAAGESAISPYVSGNFLVMGKQYCINRENKFVA
jgi:hypothetical protein